MSRFRYLVLGLALIVIDQLVKSWISARANIYRNYQFAFSLPVPTAFMYAIYAVILIVIVVYIIRRHRIFGNWESLAWTLVVAGSVSNITERSYLGYVKDFIYLANGVFNLADFYILLGIFILFIVRGRLKHAS